MFQKILIANRGEIACRIIKTARRMGIATVAVYSEADRRALHVSLADQALPIGPAPAAQSYLSIENIIAACKASGAEAVHPGYGFLSEQADFCRALQAEGILFIGPNADAIDAMGDKIAARDCAKAAGVAIVPGSAGALASTAEAVEIAEAIGYPVMLKASAGGGGKGLRIAASRAEVADAFARAASEAASAFGDGRVFVEKYVTRPRHIEMQVLGDKHGNLIHLGERECSIQRRHQKVIEEAPSPCVDPEMRAAMAEQALALARAVGYDSAGTVEFVAGADKRFYFLEMNTRLQVEHGVTECVTGLDIVEAMIRIAAGVPLSVAQQDIAIRGHAIETRIYAEDPTRGFLPSTGRLTQFRPPRQGEGIRLDCGVTEGGEVSIHYDPMLAKLITYAPDRASAIAAQAEALDELVIDGPAQNLNFLGAVMADARWQAGEISTGFIAEAFPQGFTPLRAEGAEACGFICVAAAIFHKLETRAMRGTAEAVPMALSVFLGDDRHDVTVEADRDALRVSLDKRAHICRFDWTPGQVLGMAEIDGVPLTFQVRREGVRYRLSRRGIEEIVRIFPSHAADLAALLPAKRAASLASRLICPMPCLLRTIHVAQGQQVAEGEALCTIEAMKMEHVLRAEHDATVAAIRAKPGDQLAVDAVIMEFA